MPKKSFGKSNPRRYKTSKTRMSNTSTFPLSPSTIISNACESTVVNSFRNLNATLLSPNNQFAVDSEQAASLFYSSLQNRQQLPQYNSLKNDLAVYMAASTFTHNADGWAYLSRGVDALLNCDISSCIHLVYYAELRAAMSIMACSGILQINKRTLYFDANANGNVSGVSASSRFPSGTHIAIIKLFEEWSNSTKIWDVMKNLKMAGGLTLLDWGQSTNIGSLQSTSSSIIDDWLRDWQKDLVNALNDDHALRNIVSYNPQIRGRCLPRNYEASIIRPLIEIWSELLPLDGQIYSILDSHLVGSYLSRLYNGVYVDPNSRSTSSSTQQARISLSYDKYIEIIKTAFGLNDSGMFMVFKESHNGTQKSFIIEQSQKNTLPTDISIDKCISMICRSILLLLIGAGMCDNLLSVSNTNRNSFLDPWWRAFTSNNGLQKTPDDLDNAFDLYSDIEDATVYLMGLLDKNRITNIQDILYDIDNISPVHFWITQFQCICFWRLHL